MENHLMRLRKAAGYSNRDEFAQKIGVNKYTYRSWENGVAMMNAAQLWDCAVALGCSPNDLLGWSESAEGTTAERELAACYRACTPRRQERLLHDARDLACLSKNEGNAVSRETLVA